MKNSNRPPATRNAWIVIPSLSRIALPANRNSVRRQKAMMHARKPTENLCLRVIPSVRPRKSGANPIGSMVTKSVTNAFRRTSNSNINLAYQADWELVTKINSNLPVGNL